MEVGESCVAAHHIADEAVLVRKFQGPAPTTIDVVVVVVVVVVKGVTC